LDRAKFPAVRADGSFDVEVGIGVAEAVGDELKQKVEGWISECWMPNNLSWTRHWQRAADRATVREENLNYGDDLLAAPEVISCTDSTLRIRLVGKFGSKFWRDWLVLKILPDLKAQFPEVADCRYIRDSSE
jgi:hypothetical protein